MADMFVFIGAYRGVGDAQMDYAAVKDLYSLGVIETYDVAVVNKDADGKVHLSKREKSTQKVAWTGVVVGAIVGVLFSPAIVPMAAAGGVTGGLIGHLSAGMSRGDMKELGDTLDAGKAALVIVGKTCLADKVAQAVTKAQKTIEKQLKVDAELDEDALEDEAKRESVALFVTVSLLHVGLALSVAEVCSLLRS